MKLKIKIKPVLQVLVLVLLMSSVLLLAIIILIKANDLTDHRAISGFLLMAYPAIFVSIIALSMIRDYHIREDHLEVRYLFGLVKHTYRYDNIRISDFTWKTSGLLIELPDGDQLSIPEPNYKNYATFIEALNEKVDKETIQLKFTTKFTRYSFILGGLIIVYTLISFNMLN